MAGSDPRFNEAQFRDAIKFAMKMGTPEDTEKRATFRWTTVKTYATQDPSGRPYSWSSVPTATVAHDDVQIDCAVEFIPRPSGGRDTPLGSFDVSRAVITILDVDYAEIAGADEVLIDGNTYDIQFEGKPDGLFGVTIHTIYADARDES